jgi:hypothetical protein
MDFNKIDRKLVITAFAGLLLSLVIIMFLNQKLNISNNKISFQPSTANPAKEVEVTISLAKIQSLVKVTITPKKEKTISAISIRITYNSNGENKPVSFTPDPTLIASGWSFPIKKILVNDTTKLVTIDISAINISTTGYILATPTTLGTINFAEGQEISSLTFSLNKSETKILAKDASELNYDFVSQ